MLIDIAQALDRFGSFAYVRPYAEMNGHWNPYCAYNSNGSYRGAAHSTKNFRMAFRRTYLIVHGGSVADINAKLVDSGMPKLDRTNDLPRERRQGDLEPAGIRQPGPQGQQRRLRTTRATSTWTSSPTTFTTSGAAWNGRRTSTSTAATPASRTRSANGASAQGSTTRTSSRRWPTSSPTTGGSRRSSTTAARAARRSTSASKPRVYARLQALHPAAG